MNQQLRNRGSFQPFAVLGDNPVCVDRIASKGPIARKPGHRAARFPIRERGSIIVHLLLAELSHRNGRNGTLHDQVLPHQKFGTKLRRAKLCKLLGNERPSLLKRPQWLDRELTERDGTNALGKSPGQVESDKRSPIVDKQRDIPEVQKRIEELKKKGKKSVLFLIADHEGQL